MTSDVVGHLGQSLRERPPSGYMKAELMHRLANSPDLDTHRHRLHHVVGRRLTNPQPRLLRHTARLAAAVWDDDLRRRVKHLPCPERTGTHQVQLFLHLVEQRLRTEGRTLDRRAPAPAVPQPRPGRPSAAPE